MQRKAKIKIKTNPENRTSPISDLFDESDINPEYIEWLENGSQGVAPSMQDFSYLSESYTKYFSRQNYSALQELPEKYDLRDTGWKKRTTIQITTSTTLWDGHIPCRRMHKIQNQPR